MRYVTWCDLLFSKIEPCNKLNCFSRNEGNKSNYSALLKLFYLVSVIPLSYFIVILLFQSHLNSVYFIFKCERHFAVNILARKLRIWVKCLRIRSNFKRMTKLKSLNKNECNFLTFFLWDIETLSSVFLKWFFLFFLLLLNTVFLFFIT